MKKTTFIFISLILLINYSKAQNTFGITGGAIFSSIQAKESGVTIATKTHIGFTAGLTGEINVGKIFSFRPELNFTQKGGNLDIPDADFKYRMIINYLELPLNFVYNFRSTKNKFFAGVGPSLNLALSGNYKISGMYSESGKLKFGSKDDADFKSFDAGVNVLAGYQLSNGLFLAANYNFGLTNISASSDEKDHTNYFGVRLGYMFNAIKNKHKNKAS